MALSDTLQDIMYAFFKDPGAFNVQFLNGTGAPSGGLNARKGDYYLNNSTGDMYYYDGTIWTLKTNLNTATGVTDHGILTGLADDDHTQYHTDARGDARYSQLGHSHGNQVLVLDSGAPIPGGTPVGTVILRRP